MNWEDFKFICFSQGIPTEAVEACKDFVFKENGYVLERGTRHPESDLGYAELAEITSPSQSIKELVDTFNMSINDYDQKGRSLTKIRTRQFKQDPGKYFRRAVLKSYYLNGGKA